MIKIRNETFETNSSSSHSLVLRKGESEIFLPYEIDENKCMLIPVPDSLNGMIITKWYDKMVYVMFLYASLITGNFYKNDTVKYVNDSLKVKYPEFYSVILEVAKKMTKVDLTDIKFKNESLDRLLSDSSDSSDLSEDDDVFFYDSLGYDVAPCCIGDIMNIKGIPLKIFLLTDGLSIIYTPC